MNQEIKSLIKKSIKIAGVTCFTAGVVAVATSGAALKAIAESGKYLAKTVKDIIDEKPQQEEKVDAEEAASAEEATVAEEAAPAAEIAADEETV